MHACRCVKQCGAHCRALQKQGLCKQNDGTHTPRPFLPPSPAALPAGHLVVWDCHLAGPQGVWRCGPAAKVQQVAAARVKRACSCCVAGRQCQGCGGGQCQSACARACMLPQLRVHAFLHARPAPPCPQLIGCMCMCCKPCTCAVQCAANVLEGARACGLPCLLRAARTQRGFVAGFTTHCLALHCCPQVLSSCRSRCSW